MDRVAFGATLSVRDGDVVADYRLAGADETNLGAQLDQLVLSAGERVSAPGSDNAFVSANGNWRYSASRTSSAHRIFCLQSSSSLGRLPQ